MLNRREARAAKQRVLETLSSKKFGESRISVGVTLPFGEEYPGYKIAIRVANEEEQDHVLKKVKPLKIEEADFDLRVIGRLTINVPKKVKPIKQPKLAIGMSISRDDGTGAGTLGFFAEHRGVKGFVSCNHVIANVDHYKLGDVILSPATSEGGVAPRDIAGHVKRVASLRPRNGFRLRADGAFAAISEERWPEHPGSLGEDGFLSNKLARIKRGLEVVKQGRSTGRRTGRIRACWIDWFRGDYGDRVVRFDDVMEIESTHFDSEANEFKTFCDHGDSGSLVYERFGELKKPVGLLFTEQATGGPDNSGFGFANPVGKVMRALGVKLVVR